MCLHLLQMQSISFAQLKIQSYKRNKSIHFILQEKNTKIFLNIRKNIIEG